MKNLKSGTRKNDVILDRTQVLSGHVYAPVINSWTRTNGIGLIIGTILALLMNIAWISSGFGQQVTVVLKSGSMPGFQAASNTRYVTDGGVVTFTSGITLAPNVTFDGTIKGGGYGFQYSGTGNVFSSKGGCWGDTILKVDARQAYTLIDATVKPFVTYDGTPQSALYYGLYISDCLVHGGKLYNSTYEGPRTLHNVCIGMTAKNIVVKNDGTGGNVKVFGNSIYQFNFDNWYIDGLTTSTDDNGLFFIESGNGIISNIHRTGGFGYLVRLWQVGIGPSLVNQDSYITNCVDANTDKFGTIDARNDTSFFMQGPVTLFGGNIHFENNTSVNKRDITGQYVTNAVILGEMAGYKFFLHNNFAANAYVSGSNENNSLIKHNCGNCGLDTGNNISLPPGVPVPSGYLDSTYYPVINGPLWNNNVGAFREQSIPPVSTGQDTVFISPATARVSSIFTNQTPASGTVADGQPVELGVKFRAAVNGYVTGVRFYKTSGNNGTHTGELYSSSGTRLAAATFTNETASGWQTAVFSVPVKISAGQTYTAAYFSPAGTYADDNNYFTKAVTNGSVTALADGTDGVNGVYKYSSTPAFPTNGYQKSNYWVDVIFSDSVAGMGCKTDTVEVPVTIIQHDTVTQIKIIHDTLRITLHDTTVIHDTIPRVCPPVVVCPVCPTCPPVPAPRKVLIPIFDGKQWIFKFDSGPDQTLIL